MSGSMDVRLRMIVPPPLLPEVASATLLLNLQADSLALNDNDPVTTWPDLSGNGRDFTQTGTARPTKQTIGGFPVVVFDGIANWMLGSNFADNLSAFSVFMVMTDDISVAGNNSPISKANRSYGVPITTGWYIEYGNTFYLQDVSSDQNYLAFTPDDYPSSTIKAVYLWTFDVAVQGINYYVNGVFLAGPPTVGGSGISNYSNSEPIRLGTDAHPEVSGYDKSNRYAVVLYSGIPNDADRAAIVTWLATKYGITLP